MSDEKKSSRLLALDALRGIAVVLMVEQHMGVWLWGGSKFRPHPVLMTLNALGGAAAPLFVTLAAIGSTLLCTSRLASGRNPDWTLLRRGLVVLAFGYLLSFITPSWFSYRTFFVLHLMGLGIAMTPIWRRLPTPALVVLGFVALGLAGPVQFFLDTPLNLENDWMSGRSRRSPAWAGVRIALAEGQFPIVPWSAFFFFGLAAGRFIAGAEERKIGWLALAALACGGVGAAIWGLGLTTRGSILHRGLRINVPFFPASSTLVLLLAGVALLAVFVVLVLARAKPFGESHVLVTLGRASLSLLLLHAWLFREAIRPFGLWQALPAGTTLLVIFAFLALAAVASRAWQRIDYRFGAEWVLRKLAP